MKRKLIHYLGLLGVVSFISYIVALVISPMAYPNYNWMAQAVSDLSAIGSPSASLWQKLALPYNICSVVNVTIVAVFIQDILSKTIKWGIYLFALMNWVSYVGYGLFPLSASGYNGAFQDIMHTYVVTMLVVLLSIISLLLISYGGLRTKRYHSLGRWALFCFLWMLIGAIGVGVVPEAYFGIPERFSVLSATFFNAVLGIYLYHGFQTKRIKEASA